MREKESSISAMQTTETARGLRQRVKQSQSEQANLKLFNTWGKLLFAHAWSSNVAERLLLALCQRLSASHGLIAQQSGATLTVVASHGHAYPHASRIPIRGQLAKQLKNPCEFAVHRDVSDFWLTQPQPSLHNYLIPLATAQRANGIMVFASIEPALSNEDLLLCESLAGLLGGLIQQVDQSATAPTADQTQLDRLTPREREVFALMPSGYTNAELGALLGISPGTAKIHLERILSKLDLRDRTQAAVRAIELGFKSQ